MRRGGGGGGFLIEIGAGLEGRSLLWPSGWLVLRRGALGGRSWLRSAGWLGERRLDLGGCSWVLSAGWVGERRGLSDGSSLGEVLARRGALEGRSSLCSDLGAGLALRVLVERGWRHEDGKCC